MGLSFEEHLADLLAHIGEASGLPPMNANSRAGRTGPPNATPGAELRSYQPTPGESMQASVSDALRPYLPRITSDRLAQAVGGITDVSAALPIVRAVVMQPVVAGEAIGEAAADPTLANVTNAGYQTAVTLARPLAALGIGVAGYLEAARRDAGLGGSTPAQAAPKGKNAQRIYEGLNADAGSEMPVIGQRPPQ